jgi:hypothetical protein
MASPTGPVPVDPDDPEFWNWDDDEDEVGPARRTWVRTAVVIILVLGLVVLLLASL